MHVRFIKVPPTQIQFESGKLTTVCHGDIYNVSSLQDNGDGTVKIVFKDFPHDGEVADGISMELLELSHTPTPKEIAKE